MSGDRTKEGLAAARASVAALIDKPATPQDLQGCVATLDEAMRAVDRLPLLPLDQQREAAVLIRQGLTEVRNIVRRQR